MLSLEAHLLALDTIGHSNLLVKLLHNKCHVLSVPICTSWLAGNLDAKRTWDSFAGGQTNPEHLRQIYQAHLMLQLKVQEAGEYQQPEAIMTAARAVRVLAFTISIAAKTHHLCAFAFLSEMCFVKVTCGCWSC